MPNDTLGEEAQGVIRGAADFLRSNQDDPKGRDFHLRNLKSMETRIAADIAERETKYLAELETAEDREIDDGWAHLNAQPPFVRVATEQKAHQQTFDDLRQINGGAYPTNLSPVVYWIPLILLGLAEWYVNFSTFAAVFIPVFAIAGTIIVGAVFAWASHMHGSYLKQLSEMIHPSVEYRNVLGRKIALVIATFLLLFAFVTVVWLRYSIISDQLGIGSAPSSGTFGSPSSGMIWSKLGPTIVINILIWGLGTLYAWAMNEKIPGLRESFRDLTRANRKLDRARQPFTAAEKRIKAKFERERYKNQVAVKGYRSLLDEVRGSIQMVSG